MDRQKLEEILELVASKDIIVSHAADHIINGLEEDRAKAANIKQRPRKKAAPTSSLDGPQKKKTAPKRPIPDEDVAL